MIGTLGNTWAGRWLTVAMLLSPATAWADTPPLDFDVPGVVECYDMTTPAFAAAYPDEKLIGATVSLSLLVRDERHAGLDELLIVIESPGRRLSVVDFCPRTETFSDIAGPVATTSTSEQNRSLESSLGTTFSLPLGPGTASITPELAAKRSHSESVEQHFEKLPPRTPYITSGTTHDGHGVFFKFRASTQTTLEGARDVQCLFVVPREWRGDYVVVRCEAHGHESTLWGKPSTVRANEQRVVGLFLSGDSASKAAAQALEMSLARRAAYQAKSADPAGLWNELRAGLMGTSARSSLQARYDRELRGSLEQLARLSGRSATTVLATRDVVGP